MSAAPENPSPPPAGAPAGSGPIKIKKYANRRLYNTASSSYVTLDNLSQMVREQQDFIVNDARTGEDITRAVLTQIIVEEEGKGQNLLPVSFLRQLIALYGDNLQALVPGYLESAMGAFAKNQEEFRKYLTDTFAVFPFAQQFETMTKQNMALFQNALSMFFPGKGHEAAAEAQAAAAPEAKGEIDSLRQQLDELKRRFDQIEPKKS